MHIVHHSTQIYVAYAWNHLKQGRSPRPGSFLRFHPFLVIPIQCCRFSFQLSSGDVVLFEPLHEFRCETILTRDWLLFSQDVLLSLLFQRSRMNLAPPEYRHWDTICRSDYICLYACLSMKSRKKAIPWKSRFPSMDKPSECRDKADTQADKDY